MIIGLTGTNASGKTSVVQYFISKGYEYFSLSDVIRDELTRRDLEHNRDNLRHVGNELRRKYGAAVLAEKICQQISALNVVIDSIRNTSEVAALRKLQNFVLIAVDAPLQIRFQRAKLRGRLENADDIIKFKELEEKEKSRNRTAQNIDLCMEQADFRLWNDKTKEDLYLQLDNLMEKLQKK